MEPPNINWNNLTEQKSIFILEQAKLTLQSTISNTEKLDNKSLIFSGFCITIEGAIAGKFFLSNYLHFIQIVPLLVFATTVALSIIFFVRSVSPGNSYPLGNSPKNLLRDEVLGQEFARTIMSATYDYQDRIEKNEKRNKHKARKQQWGLIILSLSPLVAIASHLFVLSSYHFLCSLVR